MPPSLRSLGLRPALPEDEPLLYRIYAGTRFEELAPLNWTPTQQETFLRMQHSAQHRDYHTNYPDASFDLILREGEPVGRLYVHRTEKEIAIIDIALLPEFRNEGIGTYYLQSLIAESEASRKPLTIYVERFNRALRLYERLGFQQVQAGDVYLFMQRIPSGK